MSDNFKLALQYLVDPRREGTAYVNDPKDSGGPTKFGVTMNAYSKFLGRLVTMDEMKALTIEDAAPFYQECYWDKVCGDKLNFCPTAIALFDTAVLYGPFQSVLLAQKTLANLGAEIAQDGIMGENTLRRINECNLSSFFMGFYNLILKRIDEVVSLNPKNTVFKNDWKERAQCLLTLPIDSKYNPKAY